MHASVIQSSQSITRRKLTFLCLFTYSTHQGMIDYKEFCDRFWLAANDKEQQQLYSYRFGKKSFFARSNWLSSDLSLPEARAEEEEDYKMDIISSKQVKTKSETLVETPKKTAMPTKLGLSLKDLSASFAENAKISLDTRHMSDLTIQTAQLLPKELEQGIKIYKFTRPNSLMTSVCYSILLDSILFYSILCYSILFYSILFYPMLFHSTRFNSMLFYYIICLILCYSTRFNSTLFYSTRYYSILCYSTRFNSTLFYYIICLILCYSTRFNSTLFYYIILYALFYAILLDSILRYAIILYALFYAILLDSILFNSILCYSSIFYSTLFYSILFYSTQFYATLCYSILCNSSLFCSIILYTKLSSAIFLMLFI